MIHPPDPTSPYRPLPIHGWIFYDERRRRWRLLVRSLRRVLARRGFQLAPFQRGWVQDRLSVMPDDLRRTVCVVTADGRSRMGAGAVWYLLACIGRLAR